MTDASEFMIVEQTIVRAATDSGATPAFGPSLSFGLRRNTEMAFHSELEVGIGRAPNLHVGQLTVEPVLRDLRIFVGLTPRLGDPLTREAHSWRFDFGAGLGVDFVKAQIYETVTLVLVDPLAKSQLAMFTIKLVSNSPFIFYFFM